MGFFLVKMPLCFMKNKYKNINLSDKALVIIIGLALLCDLMFPKIAVAVEPTTLAEEPEEICISIPRAIYCGTSENLDIPSLTFSKDVPIKTFWVLATAYSSTPDQTDDTPFITAMGTHVRDGIVATNILKFKTRVKFPNEYGDKWFVVEDRMNSRYNGLRRMDIWMPTREEAKQFGAKWLEVEIY